jgi:hypothetical protein
MSPDNEEHREAHLVESCIVRACIEANLPREKVTFGVHTIMVEGTDHFAWQPIIGVPIEVHQTSPKRCSHLAAAFQRNFKLAFGIE